MIDFGTGRDQAKIGPAGVFNCPICRMDTEHSFVVVYRYAHVYHVMGVVTERKFMQVCNRCNNASPVQRNDMPKSLLQRDPIPIMRRYGLFIGPPIVFILALALCFFLLEFVIK